jgi:hypothetical protein
MALAQELAPKIRVHGDLAPACQLWRQREAYAGLLALYRRPGSARPLLSDLVNPLVISEAGQLKPVADNMHACFNIGHLQRLHDAAWMQRYSSTGVSALQRLVGQALISLESHDGVVDWFDLLARRSRQHPLAVQRAA